MSHLATWAVAVITTLTSSTKIERLRTETEDQMHTRFESIGSDLEKVVESAAPIFPGDENRHRTASLMLAIAFYESGFIKSVDTGSRRGDQGRSYCIMQIQVGAGGLSFGPKEIRGWTGLDLSSDRSKCLTAGLVALRMSVTTCGIGPDGQALNLYATGNCATGTTAAKHRWAMAQRIATRFPL